MIRYSSGMANHKLQSRIERRAAELRAVGAGKLSRREIEQALGRSLSRSEARALAMATDSKRKPDPIKRQHARRNAALVDALNVTHPSNSKGRSTERTSKPASDSTHTRWLPDRGHTLRARYTDEPNPNGNENEQRLARIVSSKTKAQSVKSSESPAVYADGKTYRTAHDAMQGRELSRLHGIRKAAIEGQNKPKRRIVGDK